MFLHSGNCGYTSISKHSQILEHNEQEYAGSLSPTADQDELRHTIGEREIQGTPISGPPSPNHSISANIQNNNISPIIYTIYGYRRSTVRNALFNVCAIALLGIPYLIVNWFPTFIYLRYVKCDLKDCDLIFGEYWRLVFLLPFMPLEWLTCGYGYGYMTMMPIRRPRRVNHFQLIWLFLQLVKSSC